MKKPIETKTIMNKIVILTLFITFAQLSFAQESISKEEAQEYADLFNQAGGTYQFQIIDSREKLSIPFSFILKIEEARDDEEIVYIPFKENVRVMILPKNDIISGNYNTLEKYAYLNSSDIK